jgi:hypothetical protein
MPTFKEFCELKGDDLNDDGFLIALTEAIRYNCQNEVITLDSKVSLLDLFNIIPIEEKSCENLYNKTKRIQKLIGFI